MTSNAPQNESLRTQLSPGTRLNGIYEIDCAIGFGGMGEIYKGHVVETGDPVAIKVLLPEFSENHAALTLFRKEASALHHIQNDSVVRYYVFTVEPVLRRPYLAMEFVDGRTLTDILNDGPLSFEAVQTLLRRLASGLQSAHEHGIIHRDISPDNIIIPNHDVAQAKIIDFGIARTTQHGTVIGSGFAGKFNYVSPEQLGLFGGNVTAKSDIYSLGLVIVEALTGKPLDMGGSQVEIIEKRRKVPDLGAMDMRIRPLLERMLQPDPDQRPASMTDVASWSSESLNSKRANVLDRGKVPRKNSRSSSKSSGARRWALAAVGFLLIACAGGALLLYATLPPRSFQPDQNGTPTPASSAAEKIRNYITQYEGGDCFFVAPVTVSEHGAAVEGFGISTEPFVTFDKKFKRAFGFEADIGLRQVTKQQCPAITFMAKLPRGETATEPRLDIDRDSVRSGEVLSGIVDRYGARNVDLILISNTGTVRNLSNLLRSGTDAKTFSLGIQSTEDLAGRQPQLLMVIASRSPVNALKSNILIDANQFFTGVLTEVARSGKALGAVIRYFMLEPPNSRGVSQGLAVPHLIPPPQTGMAPPTSSQNPPVIELK
jgi:serine/threonine-protein kinase